MLMLAGCLFRASSFCIASMAPTIGRSALITSSMVIGVWDGLTWVCSRVKDCAEHGLSMKFKRVFCVGCGHGKGGASGPLQDEGCSMGSRVECFVECGSTLLSS